LLGLFGALTFARSRASASSRRRRFSTSSSSAADQLGLAARFLLAAGEFGFVDLRRGGLRRQRVRRAAPSAVGSRMTRRAG
jgi:hypothetical protein